MANEKDLLNKLKSLTDSQFREVVSNSNIDDSHIPQRVAQTEKAIELIKLIKQQNNGLEHLESVVNSIIRKQKLASPIVGRTITTITGVAFVIFLCINIFNSSKQKQIEVNTPKYSSCSQYDNATRGKDCPDRSDNCRYCS